MKNTEKYSLNNKFTLGAPYTCGHANVLFSLSKYKLLFKFP